MNCNSAKMAHKARSYDSMRYVGYEEDYNRNAFIFTNEHVALIQKEVSRLLRGVDPQGRVIQVTRQVVLDSLDNIASGYLPETGAPYGRYMFDDDCRRNDVASIIGLTINFIASAVKTDLEIQDANSKLTVWTTVLGDFNDQGLRSHAPIKIRERRPDPMMFNMNY
jgi:hypothetical protein